MITYLNQVIYDNEGADLKIVHKLLEIVVRCKDPASGGILLWYLSVYYCFLFIVI